MDGARPTKSCLRQLTISSLWMQYSFVRYQHGHYWTPFGPVGGGRKRKSSRNRKRLSSAEQAKAAVLAAGGEVWWDSPVPDHPPPPTPIGADGLAEPFLLSAPSTSQTSPPSTSSPSHEYGTAGGFATVSEATSTIAVCATAKDRENIASATTARPISTPARASRTVDVGLPGATPLQIQHIAARP